MFNRALTILYGNITTHMILAMLNLLYMLARMKYYYWGKLCITTLSFVGLHFEQMTYQNQSSLRDSRAKESI